MLAGLVLAGLALAGLALAGKALARPVLATAWAASAVPPLGSDSNRAGHRTGAAAVAGGDEVR